MSGHTVAGKEPRVVSLLASTTDIVVRLGMAHCLVGRSHSCDSPPLVTTVALMTQAPIDASLSSAEINEAITKVELPVYALQAARISALEPDIIFTQSLCSICASTEEDLRAAIAAHELEGGALSLAALKRARVVSVRPRTLEDVFADVQTIATALGVSERGVRLVASMRSRLEAIAPVVRAVVAAGLPAGAPAPRPVRIAHIGWIEPLMGSGYWVADCAQYAAAELNLSPSGRPTVRIAVSDLADMDAIVFAPCGFGIDRIARELRESPALLESDAWRALPAVASGAVYVADGNRLFNGRSSSEVVTTAELLAELSHPALVGHWGHHGKEWVRLSELERFAARPAEGH
jgi:iron complex transport system substrate-binding protein